MSNKPGVSWSEAETLTDNLDTEIRNLVENPTSDNAVCLVRSVMEVCRATSQTTQEYPEMLPQPVPVTPEDLRRSFEVVARLNNEMYRWTSRLSYNGSYVGEPEGLLKRNIREIERIMDTCRTAILKGGINR
ncbi:hypothetical protein ACI5M0_002869 [Salmonella enterica subsp. enterica serovar Infantis]